MPAQSPKPPSNSPSAPHSKDNQAIDKPNIGQIIHSKLKATGIHLLISLAAFLIVLWLILGDWYPQPFFTTSGGWHGIRLMALIDLALGPLLTFIIYNTAKSAKAKVFDFTVIGIVQLSAMLWGGHTVYQTRPVAMVYWERTMFTVSADYLALQNRSLSDLPPTIGNLLPMYYTQTPDNVDDKQQMLKLIEQRIPPYAQVQLYQPFKTHLPTILGDAINIEKLPWLATKMAQVNEKYQQKITMIPLQAKYNAIALFINQEGEIKDYWVTEAKEEAVK